MILTFILSNNLPKHPQPSKKKRKNGKTNSKKITQSQKMERNTFSFRVFGLSFILFTVFDSILEENGSTTARRRRKARTPKRRRRRRKTQHKKGQQRRTAPPPRTGEAGKQHHPKGGPHFFHLHHNSSLFFLISLRHFFIQFQKGQRQHNPKEVEGGNTKKEGRKAAPPTKK